MCFSGFMLVKLYHMTLEHMFMLQGCVQLLGWVLSPHIGRLIDRAGERRVLAIYYLLMVAVFAGYVLSVNPYVLGALYVVDGTFFFFAMALTAYAGKLAPPSERTATLGAGVAVNHIAAVATPLVSGILCESVGPRAVFIFGIVGAFASLSASRLLPKQSAFSAADGNAALSIDVPSTSKAVIKQLFSFDG